MAEAIKKLFDDILHQKISFADFSAGLKELQVDRVSVDFVRKEHVFYLKNARSLPFLCQKVMGLLLPIHSTKKKLKKPFLNSIGP